MNTFELFRAVCWALIAHNERLAKLEEEDPRFADCPSFCSRPEQDMKRGCPDCPVTMLAGELEEEVEEEFQTIAERRGFGFGHVWKWSFRKLRADVDTIAALEAAHGDAGTNPRWTIRERILVSHLRALRSLHRRLEAKRLRDELKSGARD